MRAILSDPDKDKLIQELQESCHNEYTLLSEEAKKKFIHKGILKALKFAFCRKKYKASIVCALRHLEICIVGVVHFFTKENAGSEALRRSFELNQQQFDSLTIPQCTSRRGPIEVLVTDQAVSKWNTTELSNRT